MRIGLRILLGYFLIVAVAALLLGRVFVQEVKPGVRQAMEDTLVDTANLLAAQAADDLRAGQLADGRFASSVRSLTDRDLGAEAVRETVLRVRALSPGLPGHEPVDAADGVDEGAGQLAEDAGRPGGGVVEEGAGDPEAGLPEDRAAEDRVQHVVPRRGGVLEPVLPGEAPERRDERRLPEGEPVRPAGVEVRAPVQRVAHLVHQEVVVVVAEARADVPAQGPHRDVGRRGKLYPHL